MKNGALLRILFLALSFINNLVPKKDNLILLYSNLGFKDNIRSYFKFLIENNYNEKFRIVCSTNKINKIKTIENVKYVNPFTGILIFFRAKYVFYCFGKYPIRPSKNQIAVNFWHGMPLKKIGKMANERYCCLDCYSYILSTSSFFRKILAESFDVSVEKILISGQPRTDVFFIQNFKTQDIRQKFSDRKIIVWLPTYRSSRKLRDEQVIYQGSTGIPLIENEEDLQFIDSICEINKTICFIKLHPMQTKTIKINCKYKNIIFINDEWLDSNEIDLYEFLSITDALITDYSSVYFEYLLLNKPIGFVLSDIDNYRMARGFSFENIEEYMPGNKIYCKEDLREFIYEVSKGIDNWGFYRKEISKIVNGNECKNNCYNISNIIGIVK